MTVRVDPRSSVRFPLDIRSCALMASEKEAKKARNLDLLLAHQCMVDGPGTTIRWNFFGPKQTSSRQFLNRVVDLPLGLVPGEQLVQFFPTGTVRSFQNVVVDAFRHRA